MADTLKASEEGLKIVYQAGRKKGWRKNSLTWVQEAKTSPGTLKRFWARKSAIDRFTFIAICEAVGVDWKKVAELTEIQETDLPVVFTAIAHSSIRNQNFVGREGAIARLNTHINQGAKIIVIQANGGVGKTTLAHEYLNSQGFDLVLDLPMAKEKDNIQLVDSVIEGWLKQDFDEEPGREFWEMLRRLKRQLQTRKIGVLIDNLEPALDGQGKFIEPHRRYVELLRVFADPTVQSVTLITSRDRLCEPDVNVAHYLLPGLDEQAWQQFFMSRHINIDIPTLNAMNKAYGGNAKAMGILCGAILEDFDGDMVAYWRNNNGYLLVKADLENLVTSQFQRLQELNSEAYRLLYRLGCYRYQDVPTVPTEGLLCLLWDVPEGQRRRVIESLRNRSLVEFNNGEYWLHPMIREEAIARLRASEDWEEANRKAAELWTDSVKIIKTVQQALRAFEAYHHYVAVKDFDSSIEIIFYDYSNDKNSLIDFEEKLGIQSWRLGLNNEIIDAISKILYNINKSYYLSELYLYLGYSYNCIGCLKTSLECNIKSKKLAIECLSQQSFKYQINLYYRLKMLEIASSINISLCLIDLGENKKAIQNIEESLLISELLMSESEEHFQNYVLDSCLILSFLKALSGFKKEAYCLAEKSELKLSLGRGTSWSQVYGLFFLGLSYKNLGKTEKSFEMYSKAISYTEENNHYTQVKAKALSGMAELYREQSDFTTALSHHSESIALLEKIGAKCDLAEAHYQLALTHQKMGDAENSQTHFQEAIRLFKEMEAPKQVEKVRKVIGKSDEI